MRSYLKIFLRLPFNMINYLIMILKGVKYETFPTINGILHKRGSGSLKLGRHVKINSSYFANPVGINHKSTFIALSTAEIVIGNNVGISNALLYARDSIQIKDNVLIGGGVQILDNDFHSLNYENRIKEPDPDVKSAPIVIGQGAFVGANSIILKGINIGKFSIVAAGSVVTKSIPANQIWGGNPAKFIRNIE